MTAAAGSAPASGTGAAIEWTYQPWRETPLRAAAAVVFAVTACALVQLASGSSTLAAVLAIAFAAQLAPAWYPTRMRVDPAGVATRGLFGWERRAWSAVGRVERRAGTLIVSPYRSARRLERFRALVLPLPRRDRAALLARLEPELRARDLA